MTTNTFKPVVAILNLSGGELLMILLSLLVMAAMVGGVIVLVAWLSRRNAGPIAAPPVPPRPPVTPTKRVCPQCGKEMSADATQGLCPSCLLKIGLGTETSDPGEPKREPAPAPAPAEIAKHFPQLEILDLLGQGGMGMVYKARQPQLDRFIALKILSPHLSQDPAFAERFNREAKALARLNHPNIVGVFDFGKAGEFYYFLMEFVDGLNLSQMEQAKKRLAPEQALAIVPKICDALQYAHDEGVVHRDIKPGNILVDRKGRVKIADFGLAKLAGQEREDFSITQSRMTLGTPQYMAPEQFEDPQKVDHRADIYSLGVVFYEMLTGELPMGRFAPPSQRVQVDVRFDEVVLKSLEKEPGRRYQHASVLKTDVETIATTQPPRPPAPVVPESAEIGDARRQVKGPAMCLLAAAIFNWVAIPLAGLFVLPILLAAAVNSTHPHPALVICLIGTPLAALALSAYVMYAAIKMAHLEQRAGAVAAGVLAMLLAPGTIIGLPAGIWALIVLNRREVREAFAKTKSRAVTAGIAAGAPPRFKNGRWPFVIGALSPLIAGAILLTVANFVSTKKATEARQAEQNDLQHAVTGDVGQHLHQRQIYYNRFTFQRLDAAPRASIRFDGLRRAGAAGVSNSLNGIILLRFDRPNQCDVSGTRDLADIRYSFPVNTTSGRWWSESFSGSGLVGSTNPSAGEVAAPNPAFGPVVERVIQARETGTNSFLDLDTGRLVTPPPEVTASTNPFEDLDTGQLLSPPPDAPEVRAEAESTGTAKQYGPALDIPQGAHRLKYIAWLRESGADLMFNSNRQLLGFDALFPMARSVSVTNRDDWENLTPEQVRTAVEAVGWKRRAAEAIRTGQPVPPDPGAIYASAAQIGSPWGGAPVVNLLGPEQSVTWFFETREGGAGILQIVGFSEIPLGVKIRYRLVRDGAASRP